MDHWPFLFDNQLDLLKNKKSKFWVEIKEGENFKADIHLVFRGLTRQSSVAD